jgi:hypothetical protein
LNNQKYLKPPTKYELFDGEAMWATKNTLSHLKKYEVVYKFS